MVKVNESNIERENYGDKRESNFEVDQTDEDERGSSLDLDQSVESINIDPIPALEDLFASSVTEEDVMFEKSAADDVTQSTPVPTVQSTLPFETIEKREKNENKAQKDDIQGIHQ